MAEFSIDGFTNSLRNTLYRFFPYESDDIIKIKHKKTPKHIRDVAFMDLPVSVNINTRTFDIGGEYAEMVYPYYHILEDSEVIRKRGKGTAKSKGSQASIEVLSDRDYSRITWNGKTFVKEYQRNVRGKRSRAEKGTYYKVGSDGVVYKINKDANYYKNIHYHYIERTLDNNISFIAKEFGLKTKRVSVSGLEDEYSMQQQGDIDKLLDILSSFE